MRCLRFLIGWLLLLALFARAQGAGKIPLIEKLITVRGMERQAIAALQEGKRNEALSLMTQAIKLNPQMAETWMLRGRMRAACGLYRDAAGDFARVIHLEPHFAPAYLARALARFRQGHYHYALVDFDKLIAMRPPIAPHLWQRGLALVLMGQYAKAAKQFAQHYTVNSNDVETAAWHFLCVAKTKGLAAARQKLLPVRHDARVPMAQIEALLAGQGAAEDVLQAAKSVSGPKDQAHLAQFYAHLYLGLYDDAAGKPNQAKQQVARSLKFAPKGPLIGDVARFYFQRLKKSGAAKPQAKPAASGKPQSTLKD